VAHFAIDLLGEPSTLNVVAKKSKMPTDLNQRAKAIVDLASGEIEPEAESRKASAGRKGGKRGGQARAENLTAEERSAIARKAAAARWGRPMESEENDSARR
jgi:hypothetical protein